MNKSFSTRLRIGSWCVDPTLGEMSRDSGETVRMEARTMRLLLCLAERRGEVVSIDELLDQVWSGVVVTPDSVYQAVTALRRLLGDDPKRPEYIATVPRRGYRMVATVTPWIAPQAPELAPLQPAPNETHTKMATGMAPTFNSRRKIIGALVAGVVPLLVLGALYLGYPKYAVTTQNGGAAVTVQKPITSIAVLPILDLTTQEMNEEYVADGMTEELIGRLSEISGLKVPSPTSSFYYKDKQLPVAQIAKGLGVDYLLDGSIRKSESKFRVATRLVRADDGYVVWTESYDQPLDDVLIAQKKIALDVAHSLQAVIDGTATSTAANPNAAR